MKDTLALGRDRDSARAGNATNPAMLETVRAQRRANCPREVRAPLAPIEAGPAQDAGGTLAATGGQGIDIDPDPAQECEAGLGDQAGVVCQLGVSASHQRIRQRDTEPPCEVVVAGPRRPQRGISW